MILASHLLLSMPDMPEPPSVPEGFTPMVHGGPYYRALGPLFGRPAPDGGVVVGLRVDGTHLNMQGLTHGGMLTTVADGALGINIGMAQLRARGRRQAQVTVSLNADFLSSAQPGDWLEAHVTITRMGQRMAFANCDLRVGAKHVLRANAVFAFVDRPAPSWDGAGPVNDG
ncbi:MAG: hypothetical protein RJA10_3115 [Pseudomonadota bacterium]|jgi:uncharacterized protein (TIGR00369 family)